MKPIKSSGCELCKREISLTFHHLIPKKYHNNKIILKSYDKDELIHLGVWVCNDCHKQIHKQIPLRELAFTYNSLEKLTEHPNVSKFTQWAAKQTKKIKR